MEKLLEILKDVRPDVDFTAADDLVGGGVLDSFDVVMIIPEINDAFGISIPIPEINPENFKNVETILALIERLRAD